MRWFGNLMAVAALAGMSMSITSLAAAPRDGARLDHRKNSGQELCDHRPDVRQCFERMCDFLELDESQRAQAQELFEARRAEMKLVEEKVRSGELVREQAHQVMQEGFKVHRESFESLLTAGQIEKLAIWEEQRKPRRGGMKGRPAAAFKQLGLSESQQEQLGELRKRHHDNLRGIRDQIKSEDLQREQVRGLLKTEHDRFRQDLAGVLTPAQLEQLDALRGDQAGPGGEGKRGRGKSGPVGQLIRHIRGELELSEAQLEQLRELAAPYRQQIRETLGQARGQELEREQVQLLIKPLVDAFVAELAGILDSGQQEQLSEFIEQLKERHRQRAEGESSVSASASVADEAELAAGAELPKGFALGQNSPNPFNPSTTISYSVPEGGGAVPVSLTIYDMRGREVIRLVEAFSAGGSYRVTWDGLDGNGRDVSSGVYIYKLQAGEYEQSRKMVMLK